MNERMRSPGCKFGHQLLLNRRSPRQQQILIPGGILKFSLIIYTYNITAKIIAFSVGFELLSPIAARHGIRYGQSLVGPAGPRPVRAKKCRGRPDRQGGAGGGLILVEKKYLHFDLLVVDKRLLEVG